MIGGRDVVDLDWYNKLLCAELFVFFYILIGVGHVRLWKYVSSTNPPKIFGWDAASVFIIFWPSCILAETITFVVCSTLFFFAFIDRVSLIEPIVRPSINWKYEKCGICGRVESYKKWAFVSHAGTQIHTGGHLGLPTGKYCLKCLHRWLERRGKNKILQQGEVSCDKI